MRGASAKQIVNGELTREQNLARIERDAQRILDHQLAIIRRGDRALVGIGFAGEILAHAWLDPDLLEVFAARATAIARAIRSEQELAPAPTPEEIEQPPAPPSLIDLAKERNRRQVERLRERLQQQVA